MIVALITDYERALIDAIRENETVRTVAAGAAAVASLPDTAEREESVRKLYKDGAARGEWTKEYSERELARVTEIEKKHIQLYKSKGYVPPYEYGKGQVKVLYRVIEGGKKV